MAQKKKTISVTQAAKLCGVGRTTVGYWIRSRKLRATRTGRNYSIPIEELIFFLRANRQDIPPELAGENTFGPCFRAVQKCWDYWKGQPHGDYCRNCTVFKKQLDVCFGARRSNLTGCPEDCGDCLHYHETYLARIQFVHQIKMPAVVYRDLAIWGANPLWARLCGVGERSLIGMGMENVVHSESLENLIADSRNRSFGAPDVPLSYRLFLKHPDGGKSAVKTWVFPLCDPPDTLLMIAEKES